MMKNVEGGFVLFDSIYIGSGAVPQGSLLTLRLEQGESIVYHKSQTHIIDYPGDYELAGYKINAFVAPGSKTMNYIIRFASSKVAYIQDPKAMDNDEINDMDTWFVVNEEIKNIIERRELGGDVEMME